MKKLAAFFHSLSETQLITLITAIGVLLTFRVMYIQHGWINDDSVLYFEVARLFADGEWGKGFSLYNWPLYSLLITVTHKLTSLSIQHSAQLLNVIFFGITTYSFVSLIKLAGGNKTTVASGALLLFSSPYIVGDALPMLLRDQGFWAFFLTSLVFFIRFYRDEKIGDAIFWQLCAILAILFRIEAITFLLAAPLVFILKPGLSHYQKTLRIFQASSLTITAGILVAFALAASLQVSINDFGRLADPLVITENLQEKITQGLNAKAEIMGREVLGGYMDDYALPGLIATLALILLMKSINSIGLLATAVLAFTYRPLGNSIGQDARRTLIWVSILAVANASIILLHTFILSTRYVIALGFMLLIFASFGLAVLVTSLKQDSTSRIQKWLVILVLVLLAFGVIINILPKRAGHNYEQEAVAWVQAQTTAQDKVFYTSPRQRFYAGAPYTGRGYDYWTYITEAINDGSIQQYDYLIINMDMQFPEREKVLLQALKNHTFVKEFRPYRAKKKIMVFTKKPS